MLELIKTAFWFDALHTFSQSIEHFKIERERERARTLSLSFPCEWCWQFHDSILFFVPLSVPFKWILRFVIVYFVLPLSLLSRYLSYSIFSFLSFSLHSPISQHIMLVILCITIRILQLCVCYAFNSERSWRVQNVLFSFQANLQRKSMITSNIRIYYEFMGSSLV